MAAALYIYNSIAVTMEIEANCIVSSDSYEKFGLSDTRLVSNETVQDFFGRGLMSKGKA
jgi:hypothetical protein